MKLSERMILGLEPTKPTKAQYYKAVIMEWWRKVNPFNYRVFLYNKYHHPHVHSASKIGYDGRYFFLLQEDGTPFKAQISMTIHDSVNNVAKATVTTHINIEEIVRIDNRKNSNE